jgi:ribosome-binding factor A
MSARTEKVGSVIQRALAPHLLPLEPQFGLISIPEVKVAPDLHEARVFVHCERNPSKLAPRLNAMAGALQREINGNFTQRRTPKLVFIRDEAAESILRIERLLDEEGDA